MPDTSSSLCWWLSIVESIFSFVLGYNRAHHVSKICGFRSQNWLCSLIYEQKVGGTQEKLWMNTIKTTSIILSVFRRSVVLFRLTFECISPKTYLLKRGAIRPKFGCFRRKKECERSRPEYFTATHLFLRKFKQYLMVGKFPIERTCTLHTFLKE